MEALVVKFESPVTSCLPCLLELCEDRPDDGALLHGPLHNFDSETEAFVQADLLTSQSGELALLHGLLLQLQITGELVISVEKFEDALRALALLRARLHATHLSGQDPDAAPAQPETCVYVFWFNLLGHLQDVICSTLLDE